MPLPLHLVGTTAASLIERMQQVAAHVVSCRADLKVTYVDNGARFRATAVVLVQRPDRIRYDIEGPHGGVLAAFAMGAGELQLADFDSHRFSYGPATPANINAMLALAPLGLTARGWVSLLLGGFEPPARAELHYDDRVGRFLLLWEEAAGWQVRVEVDPESARVAVASATRGGAPYSNVTIRERDGHGVPRVVEMTTMRPRKRVTIVLQDVTLNDELDLAAFHLDPAPGLQPEYLGAGSDAGSDAGSER